MQKFDSEKAARVWQRVQSESPEPRELSGLPLLAAEERILASWLRQLGKRQPGAEAMARECVRHEAILRGICAMTEQPKMTGGAVPALPRDPLRSCYAKTMQTAVEYDKLMAHPEYGCAFRMMAEKKREHACRLLEMAGRG